MKTKLILFFIAVLAVLATVGFTQGEKRELLNCLADNQTELIFYLGCKADCDYAQKHRAKYSCMCELKAKPCETDTPKP